MKGKKIAVVGAGSIGLYYGARLAGAGYDVHFLLRAGLEEARREGIRVYSKAGDLHLPTPQVYETPEAIGPVDLVIIGVKATANAALEKLLPPLLKEDTALLTLQNGLGNEEFLAERFGGERVLGGLCFVCLNRRTPASVDHIGHGTLSLGEYQRPPQARTQAIGAALRDGGIEVDVVENLAGERWRKLVWNVPFNGLAVAEGGVTVDALLADPRTEAECRALMAEVIAIAAAEGHEIPRSYIDFQIERTIPMGAYRPSTMIDWLAGHELEIAPIWEEPLQRARAADVAVPHLTALYEKLLSLQKK